jgi:hypothetical protein
MRHPVEQRYNKNAIEADKRFRQIFGHGTLVAVRNRSSSVDMQQLYSPNGRQLRILKEGNGAVAGDIGKFWFVVGYSTVGGPDIVPDA